MPYINIYTGRREVLRIGGSPRYKYYYRRHIITITQIYCTRRRVPEGAEGAVHAIIIFNGHFPFIIIIIPRP